MFCSQCGTQNAENALFCQKCGKPLETSSQDEPTLFSPPPTSVSPYGTTSYESTESTSAEPIIPPPPPDPLSGGVSNPYEQPPLVQAPSASPKSGRRRWIVLSSMGVVLLLLLAVGGYLYANRSTPTKTLQTACDAYTRGDYFTIYDQFSSNYQSQQGSGEQFAAQARTFAQSHGGVSSCTITTVNESSSSASSSGKAVYGDGSSLTLNDMLVNENGVWKISNITFS